MKRFVLPLAGAVVIAGCSRADIGPEPSLAPRAAEAIDPRVAIPADVPPGSVDPAMARRLAALVAEARGAAPAFDVLSGAAERMVAVAGPATSESWIAAQQSLSRLVGQHGVTTRIAADIDAIAATRLETQRWIGPADQQAIAAAAAEVAAISNSQAATIVRLRERLAP